MPRSRHVRAYLASITALSSAAIAAAAGSATAAPVYIPVNAKVGFGHGFGPDAAIHLTKGQTITVTARSVSGTLSTERSHYRHHRRERAFLNRVFFGGVDFAGHISNTYNGVLGAVLSLFPKGATTQRMLSGGKSLAAWNLLSYRGSTFFSGDYPGPFRKEYALFSFTDTTTDQLDYGWLELSAQMGRSGGPNVTIIAAAYDPSGNPLPAGEGVPKRAAIPEPSSLPLEFSGLAALALGASGVRSWRSARAKAPAAPQRAS